MSEHIPRNSRTSPRAGNLRLDLTPGDHDAIAWTFNRYALGTDMADRDMLLSIFAPSAMLVGSIGKDPPFLEVTGSVNIADYVVDTRQKHAYSERHFITNLSAWLMPDETARAHAYFLVTRIEKGAVISSATGTYQADLAYGDDLLWRFARIDVRMDTSLL